ncbi:glutamine synthetase [Streptomyces sp. NPDC079167]
MCVRGGESTTTQLPAQQEQEWEEYRSEDTAFELKNLLPVL